MSGQSASSQRMTGSKGSKIEPAGARQYLGGSDASTSRFTVRRLTPSRRAISLFDTPSAAIART
jgi:hypothetical protein